MSNRKHTKDRDSSKFNNDKIQTHFEAKTPNQNLLIRSFAENIITIGCGDPGTGKTLLSLYWMCTKLLNGEFDKLILTRPFVNSGKGIGFLKGDLQSKIEPYLTPFLDYLDLILGVSQAESLFNQGKISIEPLEFMRGNTFNNSIMLLDEGQNCTFLNIKMFISRIGINSKVIIVGDTKQSDLYGREQSGLESVAEKLQNLKDVGLIRLDKNDIMRSGILKSVLGALENE